MELRVISKYSYNYREHMHVCDDFSEAVPDQSLTIKEILSKAEAGMLPSGIVQNVVYDTPETDDDSSQDSVLDQESFSTPNFDLTDLDENRAKIIEFKERIENEKKRKQELEDENKLSRESKDDVTLKVEENS